MVSKLERLRKLRKKRWAAKHRNMHLQEQPPLACVAVGGLEGGVHVASGNGGVRAPTIVSPENVASRSLSGEASHQGRSSDTGEATCQKGDHRSYGWDACKTSQTGPLRRNSTGSGYHGRAVYKTSQTATKSSARGPLGGSTLTQEGATSCSGKEFTSSEPSNGDQAAITITKKSEALHVRRSARLSSKRDLQPEAAKTYFVGMEGKQVTNVTTRKCSKRLAKYIVHTVKSGPVEHSKKCNKGDTPSEYPGIHKSSGEGDSDEDRDTLSLGSTYNSALRRSLRLSSNTSGVSAVDIVTPITGTTGLMKSSLSRTAKMQRLGIEVHAVTNNSRAKTSGSFGAASCSTRGQDTLAQPASPFIDGGAACHANVELRHANYDISYEELIAQYSRVPVAGDGNCLFRCLSFLAHGQQNEHMHVRQEIVTFVCNNWEDYAIQTDLDLDTYRAEMSKSTIYGSEMEAFAFCKLHRLNVMIHRLRGDLVRWNLININEGANSDFHHMLFSGMASATHLDGHYEVLVSKYEVPEYEVSASHTNAHQELPVLYSTCSPVSGAPHTGNEHSSGSSYAPVSETVDSSRSAQGGWSVPCRKASALTSRKRQRKRVHNDNMVEASAIIEALMEDPITSLAVSAAEEESQDFVFAEPLGRPRRPHRRLPATYRSAMGLVGDEVEASSCGALTARCPVQHCNALHFEKEKKNAKGLYGTCCTLGKVALEPLKGCPEVLLALYTTNDPAGNGAHFRKNIRQYNSAFQFASFNADNIVPLGVGPYCFKIQGNIYHRVKCANPRPEVPRTHNQIYFVDSERATDRRIGMEPSCRPNVARALETMMRELNPFCASFIMMRDKMAQEEREAEAAGVLPREIILNLVADVNTNLRTHNLPASENEIAVVFFGEEPPFRVDVQCHSVGGRPQKIAPLSGLIDPMVYPLLFPHGDLGFRMGLCHHRDYGTAKRIYVTMRQFFKYRIAIRDGFSIIHSSGKLFQQYIVDAWVRTEGNELFWIKKNQPKLRRESYRGLADYVAHQAEHLGAVVGALTILPATHINSPRYFEQNRQDAMTTMMKNGLPDYMITFSANPGWPEIKDNLRPGERANDRPDLAVPCFQIRLEQLIEDLMVKKVLGEVANYVYAIEFQKRGLPHAHIVVTMAKQDKPETAEDLDNFIRADIPDPDTEPRLYEIVTKKMIHNVCSPRCWKPETKECSKKYPKPFSTVTIFNVAGRAMHKRLSPSEGGRSFVKAGHTYTNRDVVPYSPYFLLRQDAHINVEACVSPRSFTYICEYITKGTASAQVVFRDVGEGGPQAVLDHDEVRTYETYRYVSAPEACYRLYEFPMFVNTDTVYRLPLHLEDMQTVVFNEEHEREAVMRAMNRDTMLTGWFKANARQDETGHVARTMTYDKFPQMFVWHTEGGITEWRLRRRGFDNIACRLYDVAPLHVELFHMRILLTHVHGATSFAGLRTVDGVVCVTFKEACIRLNLLADDEEYDRCMVRGATFRSGRRLRILFAHMVMYCMLADPPAMLQRHMESMIEGYIYRGVSRAESVRRCLAHLSSIFSRNNCSSELFGLPIPGPAPEVTADDELIEETAQHYVPREIALSRREQLNEQQRAVYDATMDEVERYSCGDVDAPKLLFVDGPGGTGKTFLFNTILANMQHLGFTVFAAAWTGIAATLLHGGQTCHRLFGLPLKLDKDSTLSIKGQSRQARELAEAHLILIDEVSMAHKEAFRAVDEFLRYVSGRPDTVFGGKPMLFGGDFRQLLPVLPGADRHAIVDACFNSSYLWPLTRKFSLTVNLRAGPEQQEWAAWLLEVGDGTLPPPYTDLEGMVEIQHSCQVVVMNMARAVFGQDLDEEVYRRAILTPTNKKAMEINEDILLQLPGELVKLYSADKLVEERDRSRVPLEVLNSMTPSGFPPHELNLKAGAIVMLLRNIDIREGLTNGTRLQVLAIHAVLLHCKVVTEGAYYGNEVYLPRIKLRLDDIRVVPFTMERVQFPVRLSYAMTVNKAQGQTFQRIGLVLDRTCFTHGQFYVAASRVCKMTDFKVQILNESCQGYLLTKEPNRMFVKNVVWHAVLDSWFLQRWLPSYHIRQRIREVGANGSLSPYAGSTHTIEGILRTFMHRNISIQGEGIHISHCFRRAPLRPQEQSFGTGPPVRGGGFGPLKQSAPRAGVRVLAVQSTTVAAQLAENCGHSYAGVLHLLKSPHAQIQAS